jgi:glycosyltransferase involved in cell wall biosynthesis
LHPSVSIIIPVYNAQAFINRCLQAVCGQTFSDIEVILVNDGSRDDTLAICEKWAQSDWRVRVISQENGGPGCARNAALNTARGDYIQFVDADDIVLSHATEDLFAAADGSDLVIARFILCMRNMEKERGLVRETTMCSRADFLEKLMTYPGSFYYSALWNKLYKRSIIVENGLRFSETLPWGEDFTFNMDYYRYVSSVHYLQKPVYKYYWTTSGQTWRTLFGLPRNIRIKWSMYQRFKRIYTCEGTYRQNRFTIDRYLFNVTLFD